MLQPKMNKLLMALGLCVMTGGSLADADPYASHTEESRKVAQEFMQQLAGTLKQQIESSGTESAISVCKEVAPALAKEYSNDSRLVSRVSLKPRNQTMGTPKADEKLVLQNFDRQQRDGTVGALEIVKVYEDTGGEWHHYMRAIPTQPLCLQCHGKPEDISANVKALLAKEYPADQAVGYSLGEIRGAVSIRQKIR